VLLCFQRESRPRLFLRVLSFEFRAMVHSVRQALVLGSLTLSLAGAARQRDGAGARSAVRVVDAIGAMVHRQHSGIRKIFEDIDAKATPGAESDFKGSMQTAVQSIQTDVEAKIKAAQQGTQASIDEHLEAVRAADTNATKQKAVADLRDEAWFGCVAEEKKTNQAVEDAMEALDNATGKEAEALQRLEDDRAFSFQTGKIAGFQCDYGLAGDCEVKFQAYKENVLQKLQQKSSDELQAEEAAHVRLRQAAEAATAARIAAQEAKDAAVKADAEKTKLCDDMNEERKQAICAFGKSVQAKCVKEGELKALIDATNKESEDYHAWDPRQLVASWNEQSEPDRKEEWSTVYVTRCMLEFSLEKGLEAQVTTSELEACVAKVKFAEQVGSLDRREKEFLSVSASNVCAEGPISFFNGKTWEVKEEDGFPAADYVQKEFKPILDPEAGEDPFELCKEDTLLDNIGDAIGDLFR